MSLTIEAQNWSQSLKHAVNPDGADDGTQKTSSSILLHCTAAQTLRRVRVNYNKCNTRAECLNLLRFIRNSSVLISISRYYLNKVFVLNIQYKKLHSRKIKY